MSGLEGMPQRCAGPASEATAQREPGRQASKATGSAPAAAWPPRGALAGTVLSPDERRVLAIRGALVGCQDGGSKSSSRYSGRGPAKAWQT